MQNQNIFQKQLITAREAFHRLNISLHELAHHLTRQEKLDQLILLKVAAKNSPKTAQVTGIDLATNTLSYQPVHIIFNDNGRREIVPIHQSQVCSLDDKVFI